MRKANGFAHPSAQSSPLGRGQGEGGFVLLLSLVIMVVISAIVGGLVVSLSTDMRSIAAQRDNVKAFWISEAGLADAVKQLKNGEINLSDGQSDLSSIQNVAFGGGEYSVSLSKAGSEVTLISTGTVSEQSRTVRMIMSASEGRPRIFDFAIFGNNRDGGTLNIGNTNAATVVISGDVHYDRSDASDTVNVRNGSQVIDGFVYSDSVTGGGVYTSAPGAASPAPNYHVFNHDYYDEVFAAAPHSSALSNLTLSGSASLNVSGVVYYRNITIQNSASLTGSGTIVATQGFTIRNDASIGPNIHILAGSNITIRDSAAVQSGGSFYSRGNILLRDSAAVASTLMASYASGSTVTMQNNTVFTGVAYAENADLSGNTVMNGSIAANKYVSDQISDNVRVTFAEAYLPSVLPTGFAVNSNAYVQKANSWAEI